MDITQYQKGNEIGGIEHHYYCVFGPLMVVTKTGYEVKPLIIGKSIRGEVGLTEPNRSKQGLGNCPKGKTGQCICPYMGISDSNARAE